MAEQICTSSHTSIPTERYLQLDQLWREVEGFQKKSESEAGTDAIQVFRRLMTERADLYEKLDRFTKEGMQLSVDAQQANNELALIKAILEPHAIPVLPEDAPATLKRVLGCWAEDEVSLKNVSAALEATTDTLRLLDPYLRLNKDGARETHTECLERFLVTRELILCALVGKANPGETEEQTIHRLLGYHDQDQQTIANMSARISDLEQQLQTIRRDRDVWRDDCKEFDIIRALVSQFERKPKSISSLPGAIEWMCAQIELADQVVEDLKGRLFQAECGCEADIAARQVAAHIVEAIDQIGIRNEFKAGIALGKALTELEKLEK